MPRNLGNHSAIVIGFLFLGSCGVAGFSSAAAAEGNCIYDLTIDGQVDGADLAVLLGEWGTDSATSDLNNDAIVDGADLAILLGAWGECPFVCFRMLSSTPGFGSGCGAAPGSTAGGAIRTGIVDSYAFDPFAPCDSESSGFSGGLAGAGELPQNVTLKPYVVEGNTYEEAVSAIFGSDGSGPGGPGYFDTTENVQYAGYCYNWLKIIPICWEMGNGMTWFGVHEVILAYDIHYPNWNAPATASAQDLLRWAELENRILEHELGHVTLGEYYSLDLWNEAHTGLDDSVPGMEENMEGDLCPHYQGDGQLVPGSMDPVSAFAGRVTSQLMSGTNGPGWATMMAAQKIYDGATNHGNVFAESH